MINRNKCKIGLEKKNEHCTHKEVNNYNYMRIKIIIIIIIIIPLKLFYVGNDEWLN